MHREEQGAIPVRKCVLIPNSCSSGTPFTNFAPSFSPYAVLMTQMTPSLAYANEGVISVISTAYGEKEGAKFVKGVPD